MEGTNVTNSDPWGCSGARDLIIFVFDVGPHIPNIEYFEVYEGVWSYMGIFGRI